MRSRSQEQKLTVDKLPGPLEHSQDLFQSSPAYITSLQLQRSPRRQEGGEIANRINKLIKVTQPEGPRPSAGQVPETSSNTYDWSIMTTDRHKIFISDLAKNSRSYAGPDQKRESSRREASGTRGNSEECLTPKTECLGKIKNYG